MRGIHRWPVDSPHKGQWRGALTFSLICAWTNGWANNRGAGYSRRHRAHHDVTVMPLLLDQDQIICMTIISVVTTQRFWALRDHLIRVPEKISDHMGFFSYENNDIVHFLFDIFYCFQVVPIHIFCPPNYMLPDLMSSLYIRLVEHYNVRSYCWPVCISKIYCRYVYCGQSSYPSYTSAMDHASFTVFNVGYHVGTTLYSSNEESANTS